MEKAKQDKRKSLAITNAVKEYQANGKTNQEKLTWLETFVAQPSQSDLERKRSTTGNIAVQNKRTRGSTKAKKIILVHMTPAERLSEKEFKNKPYKITAGVKAYVFCLACLVEVSIKRETGRNAAEMQDIKHAAGSMPFSVSFEGTTRVCEAFAVVVRFLDQQFNPIQKLLTISFIDNQLNGLTTATEIVSIIFNRFGIEDSSRVTGFMRDAVELGFSLARIDEFLAVKAVKTGTISTQNLQNELPQYLAACQGVSLDIDLKEFELASFQHLFRCLSTLAYFNLHQIITLASQSESGWAVIDEYERDDLAEDTDDENRVEVENRAERKLAKKRKTGEARMNDDFATKSSVPPIHCGCF
ncbi:hypothetical protein EMCRGX_G030818 [Ephydatia muelleri]